MTIGKAVEVGDIAFMLEWMDAQGWLPVLARHRDGEGWVVHTYPSPLQSASTVHYGDSPQLALARAICAAAESQP